MSLQTGQKGDLYIRFTMKLPNFTEYPPETTSQLKKIFQSFHKEEVKIETDILQLSGLTKTIMNDCNQHVTNQVLDLLKNQTNTENRNKSHEQEGTQQCVQQ
jgi:hypothetical protein